VIRLNSVESTAHISGRDDRRGGPLSNILLAGWVVLLAWFSLMPSPPQMSGFLGWDKLQHAFAYGVLAWLVARVLIRWRALRPVHAWWVAFLCAMLFGVGMELLQWGLNIGRSGEWFDLIADALGALCACVIFRHFVGRKYA